MFDLNGLDDPARPVQEIDTTYHTAEQLTYMLAEMVRLRLVEKKLAHHKQLGEIGGPVHLGIGQEAVSVGVALSLRASDRVFSAHRSHYHLLAMGADLRSFFSEILGKKNGLSGGMGGSMHLQDFHNGFYGSVPIVAGTVPIAAGAALAAKMDRANDVAIAYLGDGAMEEGVVHETLNLASSMELPVVFIVENNLFASHMHITSRQSQTGQWRFAVANDIDRFLVDGNDVVDVNRKASQLIKSARKNSKPGFLEVVTYRWLGHVDWREDQDVGVNRSARDIALWKKHDPIKRLFDSLLAEGSLEVDWITEKEKIFQKEIDESWKFAQECPWPDPQSLIDFVYAGGQS